MKTTVICAVLTAVLLASPQAVLAQTPTFQGLGDLPGFGFDSYAKAMADDGSIVVGYSSSNASPTAYDFEAFRWTETGGMAGLGYLPGANYDKSEAEGISGDGSTIVGFSVSGQQQPEAFRWTASTGMVGLGDLPGGRFYSRAQDASFDGSVIVGFSQVTGGRSYSGDRAFRWTASTQMVDLGTPFGSGMDYEAAAVSADGAVIVGSAGIYSIGGVYYEAFRWTEAGGMVALGHVPGHEKSYASDVSADGTVVVGYSHDVDTGSSQPFRWTPEDGVVGLGELPGGNFIGHAWGVSADGSIVVGDASITLGYEAFIWNADDGMRNLRELLTNLGLDLTGWRLTNAQDISPDGSVICGTGYNPAGDLEGWVAVIPEPATLWLLALGGLALVRRKQASRE